MLDFSLCNTGVTYSKFTGGIIGKLKRSIILLGNDVGLLESVHSAAFSKVRIGRHFTSLVIH